MEISSVSVWVLAFIVALNTLFIAGLAGFLYAIHRKLDEGLKKVAPLIDKATTTLGRVDETTAQLQDKVDAVLVKTTALVDQVSERVDTTTAIAEEVVTEPLIGAASIMAGIQRGWKVYTERSSEKGDGRGNGV